MNTKGKKEILTNHINAPNTDVLFLFNNFGITCSGVNTGLLSNYMDNDSVH